MREHLLGAEQEGRRLDRVLKEGWPDVPLGARMKALRIGLVRLEGRRVPCDERVEAGQTLRVPWEELPRWRTVAEPVPPSLRDPSWVLYRDRRLLAADKPAGWLSQPDRPGGDSLVTRVWDLLGIPPGAFRPAAAHRLDRNTSGVVLVALEPGLLRLLAEGIRERRVRKTYWALVAGVPEASGEIALSLRKLEGENRVVEDPLGDRALTRFRRLGTDGEVSLLELDLVTGRPHQARVHLALRGLPILGDRKYAPPGAAEGAPRPLLHARRVDLPEDPDWGDLAGRSFDAPLPEDLEALLRRRRIRYTL